MEATIIIGAINAILEFNKTIIIDTLQGSSEFSVSKEKLQEVKKACTILAEADLYPFNVKCTAPELLTQIEEFIENAIRE